MTCLTYLPHFIYFLSRVTNVYFVGWLLLIQHVVFFVSNNNIIHRELSAKKLQNEHSH